MYFAWIWNKRFKWRNILSWAFPWHISEKLVYPTPEQEVVILDRLEKDVFNDTSAIINLDDVLFLQRTAKLVYVDQNVKRYIDKMQEDMNAIQHRCYSVGNTVLDIILNHYYYLGKTQLNQQNLINLNNLVHL